jgi:two-component system sensor histidine kinase ResE
MELDRQKTQFFMFSSHELKSPIIAVKSSIDGVIQSFGSELNPRGLEVLKRASRRAEQMLLILKELIDLSRNRVALIEQQEHRVDIIQVLRDVVQEDRIHADSKGQEIKMKLPGQPVWLKGEEEDFRKVFTNLLGNAIRYTPEKGEITIAARTGKDRIEIDISDTGIGIPEEDKIKIFNEFYRSENAKKMISFGTGLGLSLVRQIVYNYQGDIVVNSRVDSGTTFTISLPAGENGEMQ